MHKNSVLFSVYVDAGTDAVNQITLAFATRYDPLFKLYHFIVFYSQTLSTNLKENLNSNTLKRCDPESGLYQSQAKDQA
jgi:hypothetical protein